MSGLLAAQNESVSHHVLGNVLVTYISLLRADSDSLASLVKTHVAHDSGYDRIAVELAALLHILSAKIHYLVAVNLVAEFVDSKTSVSVTVISEADIKSVINNVLLKSINMC